MTSNAGVRDMDASPMGFIEAPAGKVAQSAAQRGRKAVEAMFSPEFRNRLDALVPFNALTPDLMGMIVDKCIAEMGKGLADKKVNLTLTPEARSWLAKEGYDAKLARVPCSVFSAKRWKIRWPGKSFSAASSRAARSLWTSPKRAATNWY